MAFFSRRPSASQFAVRWKADDVPIDLFDLRPLKLAVDSRAKVFRRLAYYSDAFARPFAEATAEHGIQLAASALVAASLDEEASILLDHDLSQLAANSRELSERIFEPAEVAGREANASGAYAEAAFAASDAYLDSGPDKEDVLSEIAPGGIGERALRGGFEANLAQQRAFVTRGAAMAARAMILAAKALVPPFGAADAAAVGVLTAHACGQNAGSANYLGPPMKPPKEDPSLVWHRATHEELVRQTSWILGEVSS